MANSRLTFDDLKKVITPCSQYYGKSETQDAVKGLKDWYEKEAFDEADLTNDWIPNDYANCHGIDIFVNNFPLAKVIGEKNNKIILFEWFCYWLFDYIRNEPTIKPISTVIFTSDIQKIGAKFAKYLHIFIAELGEGLAALRKAEQIGSYFVQICNDEGYTEIDDLKSDLDHLEGSDIFHQLIAKYPQYRTVKKFVFKLLQLVVFDNYPPFDRNSFTFEFSPETFEETRKIVGAEIDTVLVNDASNEDGKENQDQGDKLLMRSKAIDFENQFPILACLMDTFARHRAYDNYQHWKAYNCKLDWKLTNHRKAQSTILSAKDWFQARIENRNIFHADEKESETFCYYVNKQSEKAAHTLKTGVGVMLDRVSPKFLMDPMMLLVIFDSLDSFAKITCAMNKFVHVMSHNENKQADWGYLPMQIDLWIIPRLVKKGLREDVKIDPELYAVTFPESGDDDDDYEEKKEDFDMNQDGIQRLGKTMNEKDCIWDIKNNLIAERKSNGQNEEPDPPYTEGKDCFFRAAINTDIESVDRIRHQINELFDKHQTYKQQRHKRYILIIDRRNPAHISNKRMVDDTNTDKTWNDRMYLICPKKCDTLSSRYAFVLNECFAANTKEFLLRMPRLAMDLGGFESANGYQFLMSYHLYFRNKVKMYWYLNQSAHRFWMSDIYWLWPRFFRADPTDSEAFQTLGRDTRLAMKEAITKFKLEDKDFDQFLETANLGIVKKMQDITD